MPKSRQRDRERLQHSGQGFTPWPPTCFKNVDGEEWKARGLSKGDVMFARALGSIHLRINSIELGLKHILVQGDGETRRGPRSMTS